MTLVLKGVRRGALTSPVRRSRRFCTRLLAMTRQIPNTSCRVAVIGAGAAGLVSLRELVKEGHKVIGFEQNPRPGGVWVYDTATDSDPLAARPDRRRVHSSMYRDLRTNLPRELMGFSDVPFTPAMLGAASMDARRFCSHSEVLAYLDLFAEMHQLHQYVQYSTQVLQVTPVIHSNGSGSHSSSNEAGIHFLSGNNSSSSSNSHPSNSTSNDDGAHSSSQQRPKWLIQTMHMGPEGLPQTQPHTQEFDAVVVANGHYNEPNLPVVEGADSWSGLQLHSHNYRIPEQFAGQTVVVVGASNSGEDVCREVAAVADQVVVAARSWKNPDWARDPRHFGHRNNISRRGMISRLHSDGRVEFQEGLPLPSADTIIYCTGYRYKFPFLEQHPATASLSGQQYVPGLYRHMFVPALGPILSFVGLPWKVVPFPQFELQAKLIARLLSGRASLPSVPDMEADVKAYYRNLQAHAVPLRQVHMQNELQWQYNDWLAAAAGPHVPRLPEWRQRMYMHTGANKRSHPEDYRDRWEDQDVVAVAEKELSELEQLLKQSGSVAV